MSRVATSVRPTAFTVNIYESPTSSHSGFLRSLEIDSDSYSHTISAFGGSNQASFSMVDYAIYTEDWLLNSIGRWVRVFDNELTLIWEGFINSISITISGLEYQIGPMTEIANRVKARYTPQATYTPPIIGLQNETSWTDNLESQAKFGIIEHIISTSELPFSAAVDVRDRWVEEYAWPAREGIYRSDGDDMRVSVECLGAFHTLGFYTFSYTAAPQVYYTSDQVTNALDYNPNLTFINSSRAGIASIQNTIYGYTFSDQTGLEVIRGLTAAGDDAGNRVLFSIDLGGLPKFDYAPTEPKYFTTLRDASRRITVGDGTHVPLWSIQPGEWIQFTDLPLNGELPGMYEDPRNLFIENVTYRMPFALELSGGTIRTLTQQIAKLGLQGTDQ